MPKKLYFKYGVMGSSKSFDLIRIEYNYRERGMKTLVLVPEIDTRSSGKIISRTGFSVDATTVSPVENLYLLAKTRLETNKEDIKVIFIDESHFLQKEQIDQLSDIADSLNIPVICYGLRTDFRGLLFEASKRLMELADEIEEIKAVCKCGRRANFTARFIDGKAINSGEQILIGAEQYASYCRHCYKNFFNK